MESSVSAALSTLTPTSSRDTPRPGPTTCARAPSTTRTRCRSPRSSCSPGHGAASHTPHGCHAACRRRRSLWSPRSAGCAGTGRATTEPASGRRPGLRRGPGLFQPPPQLARQLGDRDAYLLEGVAVTQRDRVVVHRLVVDRYPPGGPDLVLAAVALADRAAGVVLGRYQLPQLLVDLARLLRLSVLVDQRENRRLDRREPGVEPQHRALSTLDLLGVVGVDHEGEHRPVDTRGRLDHVGDEALAAPGVHILELLAGELRVLGQVEVAAVRDPLELRPAHRKVVFHVGGGARIVRELVLAVRAQTELLRPDPEIGVPAQPLAHPVLMPVGGLGRRDEELHLHLLELERPEDEIARRDLVAEGLADLRDSERRLLAAEAEDVLEVDEDALRGLGPEVRPVRFVLHRADEGLEHQVEPARLGELAAADGTPDLALGVLVAELLLTEVVLAKAPLALPEALHERVGEAGEMPGGLPDPGVLDDRGVERDDVIPFLEHRAPPLALHVVLQQDAVVAVVVGVPESAVDLRGGEDESAPLAEGDDLVEGHFRHWRQRNRGGAGGARTRWRLTSSPPCRSTSTAAPTATPSR